MSGATPYMRCVRMNNNEKMKRTIILALMFSLLLIGGCTRSDYRNDLASSMTTPEGIHVYLEKNVLSPDGRCVVVYENPTDREAWYGYHFHVERLREDGEWEWVEFKENLAFLDVAFRLEDHDIIRQEFGFGSFREPLSEGIYRIIVDAFSAKLEFEIREGGAIPEKPPTQEELMLMDMSDPPELEKDWQWYRMWSYVRYFHQQDENNLRFVPGENGLVAFAYLPKTGDDFPDPETTCACLRVVDRKTGKIYEVFEEPCLFSLSLEAAGDGFSCKCEDGTYQIRIIQDKVAVQKK